MATIPLMLDEDVESGQLPTYDEAIHGRQGKTTSSRSFRQTFFTGTLSKEATVIGAVSYANISIRLGFLRKVVGILAFQLLLTTAFGVLLLFAPDVRFYIQQEPWIVLLSIIGSLILLFAVYVNAHNVPLNYILLIAWTAFQSTAVCTIVSFYEAEMVIAAVGLTAIVVFGIFAYTLQSKRDFQKHWAAVFCLTTIFIVASIVQLFAQFAAFDFAMAVGGAILFSMYLILDIDRITHHSSPEDYISASVSLYLDIINIFLRILQIIGEMTRQ